MGGKVLPFPEVRGLMAKYGKTQQDMGNVIGCGYATFAKKINNKSDFSMSDMLEIRMFFVELGENPRELTIEHLFFTWKNHYSEGLANDSCSV